MQAGSKPAGPVDWKCLLVVPRWTYNCRVAVGGSDMNMPGIYKGKRKNRRIQKLHLQGVGCDRKRGREHREGYIIKRPAIDGPGRLSHAN